MKIILLGPPGAGKGTQAKKLAKILHLEHISTGDILRQNVKEKTPEGKEARDFMDRGMLVPDELVAKMLQQKLQQVQNGFILDGYPRNLNQAKTLEGMFKESNNNIDLVIYLDTSEATIIQRLTGRLVCSVCGANFHTQNMPPKVEGVCDHCGGRLYQRSDDKEETVKKRVGLFKDEVALLIKYYEDRHILRRISADDDAQIVLDKIVQLAQKLK